MNFFIALNFSSFSIYFYSFSEILAFVFSNRILSILLVFSSNLDLRLLILAFILSNLASILSNPSSISTNFCRISLIFFSVFNVNLFCLANDKVCTTNFGLPFVYLTSNYKAVISCIVYAQMSIKHVEKQT